MSEEIHGVQSYPEIFVERAETFLVVPPGLVEISLATGASRYYDPTTSVRLHVAVRVAFPSMLYRIDTGGPERQEKRLAAVIENNISHAICGDVAQTLQSLSKGDDVTHWISVPDLQKFEIGQSIDVWVSATPFTWITPLSIVRGISCCNLKKFHQTVVEFATENLRSASAARG
jgi:hypothetical protein